MRVSKTALAERSNRSKKPLVFLSCFLLILSSLIILSPTAHADWDWRLLGDYVPGSSINALICEDSTFFVGCENGKVFQCNESTDTWTQTGSNAPGSVVNSLAYGDGQLFAACENGAIYVNDLLGDDWTITGSDALPGEANAILYTNDNLFAGCGNGVVYKYDQLGNAWSQMGTNSPGLEIFSLADNGITIFAGCDGGIVYQNDLEGGQWTQTGTNSLGTDVHSLLYAEGTLYAGCYFGDVYQNDLSGGPWIQTGSNTAGYRVFSLAYDGSNLYAGCDYREIILAVVTDQSYNGPICKNDLTGNKWSEIENSALKTDVHCLVFNNGALYAGTKDGTVYKYHPIENTLSRIGTNMPSSDINTILYCSDRIFAGCSNGIVYEYGYYYGEHWNPTGSNNPGSSVLSSTSDGTNLYIGCINGKVYSNDLSGGAWNQIGSDLPGKVFSIAFNENKLYAACETKTVFENDLSGGDWIQIGSNSLENDAISLTSTGNILYAGCKKGNVYKNELSGGPWVQVGNDTGLLNAHMLCSSDTYVYAGDSKNGLYRKNTAAGPWEEFYEPIGFLNSAACEDNTVYVADSNGYVSAYDETGHRWVKQGNKIHNQVNSFTYDGSCLYAGCDNGIVKWIRPEIPPLTEYIITARTEGKGGAIKPSEQHVNIDSTAVIEIEPDEGYEIASITDNGEKKDISNPYTIENVDRDHEVVVEFRRIPSEVLRSSTWYLAEGSTAWGFETYVTVENPNKDEVEADISYMTSDGTVQGGTINLPPESQTTINPQETVGESDFSTRVTAKGDGEIAVDRTMIWTGPGAPSPEGHSSIGVNRPSDTWYLPEGSSAWGFETWLLIQNPNDAKATSQITYMIEGEGPKTVEREIGPDTRSSFNMEAEIGQKDASIKVESDVPVVVERSMYRTNMREGHNSVGASAPSSDFYFAEGTTAWGFTSYLLVQNPNNEIAEVTLTYMTPAGSVSMPSFEMEERSRKTVRVNDDLTDMDFSAKLHGSKPIVAERAVYWGDGSPQGEACTGTMGMGSLHSVYYFPNGNTSDGHETWTLVMNPNPSEVEIEITYLTPTGEGNLTISDTLKPNSRKSYNMSDSIPEGKAAAIVTCKTPDKKIMAERAMYWNGRGAGTATIGACDD